MMSKKFLPEAELERMANRLLARYEGRHGPISCPPVPVESILEDVLDLNILWDTVPEKPGQSILAGLDPNNRTAVFNETRLALIQETPVCTTPCWRTKPATGKPMWIPRSWNKFRCLSSSENSDACTGNRARVEIPKKVKPISSWAFC